MKTVHAFERQSIDELYRWFASETAPTSAIWTRLCLWVADHPEVNRRLDPLPGLKRQPNLFLGALKYLGAPVEPGPTFAAWIDHHWDAVERVIMSRFTQTNEPGRCAVLAPMLASLPQPITLLEVGPSAGLCLLPDRYRYDLGDGVAAPQAATPDAPLMVSKVDGTPPGDVRSLAVAARAGLDANPLDAADPDDVRWLRSLVWPGEDARESRLAACLAVGASESLTLMKGDLRTDLDRLFSLVKPGTTPVVQHSATLAYLPREDRDAFEASVRSAGVHWLSFEGPSVMTSIKNRLTDRDAWDDTPNFVVALDGQPIGRASAHGGWVRWY